MNYISMAPSLEFIHQELLWIPWAVGVKPNITQKLKSGANAIVRLPIASCERVLGVHLILIGAQTIWTKYDLGARIFHTPQKK